MKDQIRMTVMYNTHDEIILTNKNGDSFFFDPNKHEEFADFLTGCEVIDE